MLEKRTIYSVSCEDKGELCCFLNGFHYEGSNPLSTKGDYKVYNLCLCVWFEDDYDIIDTISISEKNLVGDNTWFCNGKTYKVGKVVATW